MDENNYYYLFAITTSLPNKSYLVKPVPKIPPMKLPFTGISKKKIKIIENKRK